MDVSQFFGDLGLGESIAWMLALFVLVLWWGFAPYFRNRRRRRDEDDNPDR